MYRKTFLFIISTLMASASELNNSLLTHGVETQHITESGEIQRITVKRQIHPECKMIHISNDMFWEEEYASHKVSKACKSTFITSAGKKIFPMKLHKDIETFAELEVLSFIEEMQDDPSMLLIDTRDEEWYGYRTIPGAKNIHYLYMTMPKVFPEEYKHILERFGITAKNGGFDFSKAKTLLLFCNGAWCSQSPKMVKALLELGYPPKKIKWYRGGMDDWLGLSMTTTKM